MIEKEQELKAGIQGLCDRLGVRGHLLMYVEEGRVKFTGDLDPAVLAPFVIKYVVNKVKS